MSENVGMQHNCNKLAQIWVGEFDDDQILDDCYDTHLARDDLTQYDVVTWSQIIAAVNAKRIADGRALRVLPPKFHDQLNAIAKRGIQHKGRPSKSWLTDYLATAMVNIASESWRERVATGTPTKQAKAEAAQQVMQSITREFNFTPIGANTLAARMRKNY
jgi:hypothetical protein